jgi:hypothetical protein
LRYHRSSFKKYRESKRYFHDLLQLGTEKLTPEQEAEIVVAEVKQELRGLFVKSEELIKRLGNALKKIVKRERDICEEIKAAMKEEIAEGIISTRTIELHCPPEWRREWKRRTKSESEKNSLSRSQSMAVAKTQDGKSVIVTEKEVGNGSDIFPPQPEQGVETGVNINSDTTASKSNLVAQQEETASPQPGLGIRETAYPIEQNEDMTDFRKKVLVSIISMSFEDLRKDMEAVFRITKGIGKIFFKVSFDLGRDMAEIEFCGITQQKGVGMTSNGIGRISKDA